MHHDFELKDVSIELKYKYQTRGQTTLGYDKMMVYDNRGAKPKVLTRKDIERGKCNEGTLVYNPNYAYVNSSTSTSVPDFGKSNGRDTDFMTSKKSIDPPSYDIIYKQTKSNV
jgi:hypothetical protein